MLDADYINRAAPPASLRYFALLYADAREREALTAAFVLEHEVRVAANAVHEVAHTKLQWWRGEIDRLINGNAQHPATKRLQSVLPHADFAVLHELLVAADLDLARMTYHTKAELAAYLQRSGSAILQVVMGNHEWVRVAGTAIRSCETLRDLAINARFGRLYWPLDELEHAGISLDEWRAALLEARFDSRVSSLITAEALGIADTLSTLTTPSRALNVLAQLHRNVAEKIIATRGNVFTIHHDLSAFEKNWTAWRAARRRPTTNDKV